MLKSAPLPLGNSGVEDGEDAVSKRRLTVSRAAEIQPNMSVKHALSKKRNSSAAWTVTGDHACIRYSVKVNWQHTAQ